MKRYNTLLVGDPDGPGSRVLSALGSVKPYRTDGDLRAADLVAVDVQHLAALDAGEFFTEVLDAGRSLAVFNLDSAANDLLMQVTGARPPANSFGAVYRRTHGTGEGRRLFHSYVPNFGQEFRDYIDQNGGGFEKMFDGFLLVGLRRHFQTVEEAATRPAPQGSMTPPYLQAPFSQATTSTWGVLFPVSGAQNLSQTTVNITLNFYFYNSNENQEKSQNNYLVVVVLRLTEMTPGGVVVYPGSNHTCCATVYSNWQYTQVFSYGATVQALQLGGAGFPSGVSMSTTSPAPTASVPQTLMDTLSSPTPIMYVITQSGPGISTDWTPTYSNTITQTDSPNLKWYTVVNKDNASANTFGLTYVMPEAMWGNNQVSPNHAVKNTSTMAMEFVNYFTFNASLAGGAEPNQSLPVQFLVTAIGTMTEDKYFIDFAPGVFPIWGDNVTATMNTSFKQTYTYDVAKLSRLGPV